MSILEKDTPYLRIAGVEGRTDSGLSSFGYNPDKKPIDIVLERLEGYKNGKAKCPAHDDEHPSLSVHEDASGKVLLNCFAGCRTEDIVRALGLSMSDLFPDTTDKSSREIERRTHLYEDGECRKTIIKYEDNHKSAFWERLENGSWIRGLNGRKPPLYNRCLLDDPDITTLFLSESEKDADWLDVFGLKALSFGGAENWRAEYADLFVGRTVIILPHNDDPGRKAAERAARDLVAKGIKVKVLPSDVWGKQKGADVADWIKAGHSNVTLHNLVSETPEFEMMIDNIQEGEDDQGSGTVYSPLPLGSFLSLDLPERDYVIAPVCPEQGLVMVYGPRGIAKTWVALQLAYAVACGGVVFAHWQAPKPRKVLYIDGEMSAQAMQKRLTSIVAASDKRPPDDSYFSILTPDLQDAPMPNLAHEEGQDAIASLVEGVDVVIVDNLACLARHGRENESESWLPVQTWLLDLRRRGKSVIIIHHAGKGGAQRGTSSREDVLDTVISLRTPKDYSPNEGARFEVHLEKARGVYGKEADPFELTLRTDNGAAIWLVRSLEDADRVRVAALKAEGYSIRDIAIETGLSKSKVQRLLKVMEG